MADYIPKHDTGRVLWLDNLATWLTANGAAHGFSPAEIAGFSAAAADASAAVTNNAAQQALALASTVSKKAAMAATLAMARDVARRLRTHPATTDADRAAAGLTVPDRTPTPAAPDAILIVPPPLLVLDFGTRGQVTVHWGPNPSNERRNGRPAGVGGCQIQAARGGIPANEALWTPLEIDTDSPCVHVVAETAPTTYAYRARYVGKNYKFGPFGDPALCTVSV